MVKDCTHKFRLTQSLKDSIEVAAKGKGITSTELITQAIENYLNVEPQIKPLERTKEPNKQEPKQTAKTALNKPQKANGVYSTAKRPNAKNSPDRVVLKF